LVDSERMAGLLQLDGYRMLSEPDGAEVVVVNTCGFIGDARDESHDTIQEMLQLKKRGRVGRVIVTGCLVERDKELLLTQYPQIDQLLGVFARDEIAVALGRLNRGENEQRTLFRPAPSRPLPDTGRRRLTLRHLAFLKIAEGCNRLCSFCSIPLMRGPYASKPIEQVVAEAQELAADGVRELVLVAQDITFYGLELDGTPQLAPLLKRLQEVDGLAWIRLMYLYPMHITDELIQVVATSHKVLPYLDIPLQHINDDVLQRMRRRVTCAETEPLLDRLRQRIDSLVLRTTMLVGFPGETDEQFEELLEFVRRQRFQRLGVFAYCKEPGTAAAELDGQLTENVKQSRRERLMAVQQEIAFAWNASQVGRRLDVMVDRCIPGQENAYVGRSYADAPEVDGEVYVTGESLSPGEIVSCEVVAAREYDLVAVAVP
jgi:ribosomal protein S12 methylthiotransferase